MKDMWDENEELKEIARGCVGQLVGFVLGVGIALMVFCMMGCSSGKVVTNTVVQHDTLKLVKLQKDSVWMHDSVYVERWMEGDTCYVTKYVEHTRWADRWKVDTVYKVKVDSVATTKIEMVEKELTWWQKVRLWLGNILIVGILVVFGIGMIRMVR